MSLSTVALKEWRVKLFYWQTLISHQFSFRFLKHSAFLLAWELVFSIPHHQTTGYKICFGTLLNHDYIVFILESCVQVDHFEVLLVNMFCVNVAFMDHGAYLNEQPPQGLSDMGFLQTTVYTVVGECYMCYISK